MKIRSWVNNLCEEHNDGTGGGAGGGSILTSSSTGSGSGASQGSSNTANGSIGASTTVVNSGSGKASTQGSTQDWKLGLPSELQEDATLRKFNDISSLAAAYINAQKLIGADKVAIPGKHATDEDWANVYKKLGLPEKLEEYALNFKEGATIDESFTNAFKETAYKLGILPKQAQALADWFSEVNMSAENSYLEGIKASQGQALEGLKNEWGKAYDANLSRAQLVLKNFGDPELIRYLDESGLGNDTKIIKLLSSIGSKMYKESPIIPGESGSSSIVSPAEAKKLVESIMGNGNHPYFIKDHPGHKAAVKEVSDLYAQMFKE